MTLHPLMDVEMLADLTGDTAVTRYEVTGLMTYGDVRRIQAYYDAHGRGVRWTHARNGGRAVIEVVA